MFILQGKSISLYMKIYDLYIVCHYNYKEISTIMKATPFLEELLHLAAQILQKNGHQDIAEQIYQHYKLPQWVEHNNPLLKKGLAKIIKEYVRSDQKILKYYQNRKQAEESESEQPVRTSKRKKSKQIKLQVESPKAKSRRSPKINTQVQERRAQKVNDSQKSNWMAKFSEPKRLQQIISVPKEKQTVEELPKKSQKAKKKRVQIQSSQYQSQKDSFELEPKKKVKTQKIKDKIIEKQQRSKKVIAKILARQQKIEAQSKEQKEQEVKYYNNANNGPKKSFSRINVNEVGQIKDELNDNSFQAKGRYGQQADSWGQFGYDKLKDTRGQSFKKTKGKLKNRAFQGNLMDINKINSIPIF